MPADTIAGFPFFPLAFDLNQKPVEPHRADELIAAVKAADGLTDLFVISHGWNNDMKDARSMYEQVLTEVKKVLDAKAVPSLKERRYAVAGVYWPSMKYAERELIPGGVAAAADTVSAQIKDTMEVARPEDIPRLKDIAAGLSGDADKQKKAVEALRDLITHVPNVPGEPPIPKSSVEEMSNEEFLRALSGKKAPKPMQGEVGGASGLLDSLSNLNDSIRNGLGLYTFWLMKDRAGKTGATGLAPVLARIRKAAPDLRIHLMGHSFGARLVTAAAQAGSFQPSTMTLMQAAFSHNGFSPKGAFRKVVTDGLVKGPILVTHTDKDRAVGTAYPIAVRLAFDSASGLGDKHDRYGGLGRNGAQLTDEAIDLTLHGPEQAYKFDSKKRIFNLEANSIILDHGDIAKPQVAYALLSAVAAA